MRKLRVKAFQDKSGWHQYQVLQEKRWWGWKEIDRKEVPDHVVVSLGCFGDTGGWVSRFVEYGEFGRDGIIQPRSA